MTSQLWATLAAGIDEAGCGPLAGPVVVAAVILNPDCPIPGLRDSKQLTAGKRCELDAQIRTYAFCYSVVIVSAAEIDQYNILHARLQGMERALAALSVVPSEALIDGNRLPKNLLCPARAIVGGDALEPAISAASILAKVARDAWMVELDERYPGYDFAAHKGYPTSLHLAALQRLGPCPEHRRSFAPVRRSITPALF